MNSLAEGLRDLIEHKGPYYISCTEGKDRTGFVCLLLEALAGATFDEIETDYMKTYENYYGITKQSEPTGVGKLSRSVHPACILFRKPHVENFRQCRR